MEEIKRRKRELVYQGAVLNVYRDQVELPNGNVAEWDYIHHIICFLQKEFKQILVYLLQVFQTTAYFPFFEFLILEKF